MVVTDSECAGIRMTTPIIVCRQTYWLTCLALYTAYIHVVSAAIENCDEDFVNLTSGVVTSPYYNYGYSSLRPYDCYWRVTVRPGHRIRVVFHAPFEIDRLGYDYLYIYDSSTSDRNKVLYRLNDKKPPVPFTTTGNSLFVVLELESTRFILGGKGFSFTFTEYGPQSVVLPETNEGLILTTDYPMKYLPNENYAWLISVPQGLHIQLIFSDWGVDGDVLEIFSGDSANSSRLLWSLTSNYVDRRYYSHPPESTMPNIFIPNNQAFLNLETRGRGRLAINYRGVDFRHCPSVAPPDNGDVLSPDGFPIGSKVTFTCDQGYTLIGPESLTCVADKHTSPFWNGETPVCRVSNNCVRRLEIESGFGQITSPGYPDSYAADLTCHWYIFTNPDYQIELTFSSPFNLADGQSVLDVYDGGSTFALRLARLTGDLIPFPIWSSHNQLTLEFTANGTTSEQGFSLIYSVSGHANSQCGHQFSEEKGVLYSPNYPDVVKRDIHCSWTLSVPEGLVIQLIPEGIEINDYVNYLTFSSSPTWRQWLGRLSPTQKSIMSANISIIVELDGSKLKEPIPAFQIAFKAVPLQVALPGVTEGIIQTPNYPYATARYSTFWWNLTTNQNLRFTFHIFGKYNIYNSELAFYEDIEGNRTQFATVIDFFHSRRVQNFDSLTGAVYIKLTALYATYFQMRYEAFAMDECPPLLAGNLSSTYTGYRPGDSINVSCIQGQILHGPSSLSCQSAASGQTGAMWDSRDISCSANPCSGMLQVVNDTYGHVTSLGFPGLTNPGQECLINITVPANHFVAVRFTACSLGYEISLELHQDGYTKYTIPDRTWPDVYTIDGFLQVCSKNPGNNARGFRLAYQVLPVGSIDSILLNESLCLHPGGIKDATWDRTEYSFQLGDTITYACRPGTLPIGSEKLICTNGTNGVVMWNFPPPFCSEVAYTRCNKTIRSGTGILSPLMMQEYEPCSQFPDTWACSKRNKKYVDGQDCRIHFDVPDGYIVQLEGIESRYSIDIIRQDYIYIYDGLSTQDALLYNLSYTSIRALPATSFPHDNLNTNHSKLLFRFVSDNDSGGRGFTIKYSVIKTDGCSEPPTYDTRGWTQASRTTGLFVNGDTIKYGCVQTYNRTGQFRVCNGTSHTWSGTQSQCLGSHSFNLDVEGMSHLYTPDYPEKTKATGSWNISAPTGKWIEVMYQNCQLGAWRTGLRIYDSGDLLVAKYYEKSWYERVRLNIDPPFIFRLPINQFSVNLVTDNTGICDIQMKLYDPPDDCGSPVPGRHQRLVSTGHMLGQSVIVICDEGFYLPGGKSSIPLTCAEDRKWTPRVPNCDAPCGKNLSITEGVIYSPNFPDFYPINQKCVWKIQGAIGTIVSLNFTILDVRTGSITYRDTVSVIDGVGNSQRYLVNRFSGAYMGFTRLSQTNLVSIIMEIGENAQKLSVGGLKVSFKVYRPYVCSPLIPIDFLERAEIKSLPENDTASVNYTCQYPFSVIGRSLITCKPDRRWDFPQPTCAGYCGGTSSRLSGSIISPGYPQPVNDSRVCEWYLHTGDVVGKGFRLNLNNVSLSEGDILEIYDGSAERDLPTQYTWTSLPETFCGTSFGLTIKLLPKGVNSSHANTSRLSACANSSGCQCRLSQYGCQICQMATDISNIRVCLVRYCSGPEEDLERTLNCTLLGIAQTLGHLFGGNVSGVDSSLNCSQEAMNVTNLSPSVFQCLETLSSTPCTPCRTSPPSTYSKFNISFAAVLPLERCQKADLTFPRMTYAGITNGQSAEVGQTAYVSCENGYHVEGSANQRVVCAHSNTWDIRGVQCTCNYESRYAYGTLATFRWPYGYSNNLHCLTRASWIPGYIIKLTVKTIRLRKFDWVKIFDGNSTLGNLLAHFDENTLSVPTVPIYSTQPQITMEFSSDNDTVDKGLSLVYASIPPGCQDDQYQLLVVNSTTSLANFSVSFLRYEVARECTWLVMTAEDLVVQTSIKMSHTNNGWPVEISTYEGDRMDPGAQTSLSNFTDPVSSENYTSKTNTFWLRLRMFPFSSLYFAVNFTARNPCPRLGPPVNGCLVSNRQGFSLGDVLPVRCDRGYSRDRENPTCIDQQGILMWDNSLPNCVLSENPEDNQVPSCQDVTTTTALSSKMWTTTTPLGTNTITTPHSSSNVRADSDGETFTTDLKKTSSKKPTKAIHTEGNRISTETNRRTEAYTLYFSSHIVVPVITEDYTGGVNGGNIVRGMRFPISVLSVLVLLVVASLRRTSL